ncbi:MAG: hypothetical protein ICV63_19450 [Coleofasciculus sp. Co-bin14]|nr:hypothetical protein [Coleofasciculus sp. Co-bin14]
MRNNYQNFFFDRFAPHKSFGRLLRRRNISKTLSTGDPGNQPRALLYKEIKLCNKLVSQLGVHISPGMPENQAGSTRLLQKD